MCVCVCFGGQQNKNKKKINEAESAQLCECLTVGEEEERKDAFKLALDDLTQSECS